MSNIKNSVQMENGFKNRDFKVSEMKRKQPFDVPEGYFDLFPERVDKLIKEEDKGVVKSSRVRYVKAIIGIAASAAAILLLILLPIQDIYNRYLSEYGSNQVQNESTDIFELIWSDDYLSNISENTFILTIDELLFSDDKEEIEINDLEDYIAFNYSDFDILNGLEE